MNGQPALSLIEAVRRRPAMFLGTVNSYGIRRLIKMVIEDYLHELTGIATIELTFNPDHHISIVLHGLPVDQLLHEVALLQEEEPRKNFRTGLLIGCSRTFLMRIVTGSDIHVLSSHSGTYELSTATTASEPNSIKLDFQLDDTIFKDNQVSYIPMNIMLQQMAYLNAGLKIISVDNRGELQRNVFYFKTGIRELFEDLLDKHDHRKMNTWLLMEIKTAINGLVYHILLGYCPVAATYPLPYIRAFANNESTKPTGSLVDGIIKGLQDAFEALAEKEDAKLKISKKRLLKQLVIFASVKGSNLEYADTTKDKLDMPAMKKEVRKYIRKVVLKRLESHQSDRKRALVKFGD
jgi:DNA gyrase/topoisomerase IV subunit B